MYSGKETRMFRAALRRCGERISVILGNKRFSTRAVVENSGKNFMRKYDEPEAISAAGRKHSRNKLAFLPYDKRFDDWDGDVFILWRGRKFLVVSDSTMWIKDDPIFIWAMLTEVSKAKGDYYDDAK